jgi:hypothetical protein
MPFHSPVFDVLEIPVVEHLLRYNGVDGGGVSPR